MSTYVDLVAWDVQRELCQLMLICFHGMFRGNYMFTYVNFFVRTCPAGTMSTYVCS